MNNKVLTRRPLITFICLGLVSGCAIPLDDDIGDPACAKHPDAVFQAAREAALSGDAERLWRLHSTNRQTRLIGEVSPGTPGYEDRVEEIARHLRMPKAEVVSRDRGELARIWNLVGWHHHWLTSMVYGGLELDWPYAMGWYTAVNLSVLCVYFCREDSGWRIDNHPEVCKFRRRPPPR
ncbi:MAG: hypothetical protein HYY18_01510 [Planctomycetes bacterium]|nr:hypothetical protein [Planctomycetota bacterium]